jgi:hypothetical protein
MKLVIKLPRPTPAGDDCLPHAAMMLGSTRGSGLRPRSAMVSRLVIQPHLGAWTLLRMDDAGGFVGDSTHADRDDALRTARQEFGLCDADIAAAIATGAADNAIENTIEKKANGP